jgi:serine/threonine protein kinase
MKQENATTMNGWRAPAWTAPEIMRREQYTEQADVFSLGVIMWEVATRKRPFAGEDNAQVALYIVEGERPSIPADIPRGYGELVQACWHEQALRRPTAERVAHLLASLGDADRSPRIELV